MATPARQNRPEDEDLSAPALQAIPAAVLVLDPSGQVLFASARSVEVLGGAVVNVARDQAPAETFPREEVFKILAEACESGAVLERLVTQDRECRRYFQVSASPLPGGRNLVVLIQELTRIVTQGDIAKEFVRQVRHDLRGPLTSMRGAVDLLLTGRLGPLEEKQKKLLGLVEKATHQMSAMISGAGAPAPVNEPEASGNGEA